MVLTTLGGMTDRTLQRIAALLRKAESTDNEHEADAFLTAAQRLATLHSVDLAVARAHTGRAEQRSTPTHRAVEIGTAGTRGLRTYVQLYLAIARANQVTCDVARNSTMVFAYGFESDLDTVDALYTSLVVQMVRACEVYLASPARAQDLVAHLRRVRTGRGVRDVVEHRPVHATTARINFQEAFAARIGRRLEEAGARATAEAIADRPAAGVEIVLRAKELQISDHYRQHSTARGTWSGYRATAGYSEGSRRAGDAAGRRARLGPASEIGGARPALPGS